MFVKSDKIVEFHSVSYEIDGTRIIDDLDFTIERGEVLVLLGESGCGKTTTLKLINRLIEPTAGEVIVEGRSTIAWDAIELRRRIGYALQDGGLFPHLSAAANVGLPLTLTDTNSSPSKNRCDEMLSLVGLDPAKFACVVSARTFRRPTPACRRRTRTRERSRLVVARRTVRCAHARALICRENLLGSCVSSAKPPFSSLTICTKR